MSDKDKKRDYLKKWYQENKDRIFQKYQCDVCYNYCSIHNKSNHLKSATHQKALKIRNELTTLKI